MSPIKERDIKKLSILRRAVRFYKKWGLKKLIYTVAIRLVCGYINFLDNRKIPTSERYLIKEILGSKMYLDVTADGLHRHLIWLGVRETYILETVKKEVKEGDIVVDIGAHIGYYALLEARIVGEKGKVYAIEPVPENIELLRKNIELNEYSNVEVYQLAIGDRKGFVPMYVAKQSNISSLREIDYYVAADIITEEINVEVITLDDFLENRPYPNIIRMDVEGYEYQVIKGMKKILEKQLPLTLFIEFHFGFLTREESIEILQTLKEAGFEVADATIETLTIGYPQHKLLLTIVSFLERKLHPVGHLRLSIDEIISNAAILDGSWGYLEICLKRTASVAEDQSSEGRA